MQEGTVYSCCTTTLPSALEMPSSIQVAQTLGITSSAFIAGMISTSTTSGSPMLTTSAGGILSTSANCVPPLLLAPNPLVIQQWRKLFELGKARIPPLAAASALSFSYVSYQWYGTLNQPKAEHYGLSAFLTILIVPYTLIFMKKVNNKLLRKAEESKGLSLDDKIVEAGLPKGESSKELLDLWATHNFIRGFFPLAGSILALWTTIS